MMTSETVGAGTSAESDDKAVVVVASPTEERNPRSVDIDRLPTLEILRLMVDGQSNREN